MSAFPFHNTKPQLDILHLSRQPHSTRIIPPSDHIQILIPRRQQDRRECRIARHAVDMQAPQTKKCDYERCREKDRVGDPQGLEIVAVVLLDGEGCDFGFEVFCGRAVGD